MKRLLTCLFIISSLGLLALSSCKKNDAVVTSKGSTSSTLSSSSTTLVLDRTKVNDTAAAITFSFSSPHYSFSAVVSNSLQIDVAGDNWKNPTSVAIATTGSTVGYSTAGFDALLLKLNLPADVASQVNVRVVNQLSSEVSNYSNVVSVMVTPFNLTSYIYVVGAFQGWNANGPDSLVSLTGNGTYTGVINFTAGNNQFLILPAKNYNNKYATTQTSTPTTTVTYNAGNNLVAPAAAGDYLVTFNLNAGTITFEQVNSYSAIGSSTPPLGNGYSVDNDLKYVNGTQQWELTINMPETGAFKIRQNHDWTWSWGVLGTPDGATLTDNNGGNIPVNTVGNYKITFNYPIAAYSVTGTPPSVTATYTLVQQ